MGINYNPRTVTDGLVLALDAGNAKSYPGSGTTWTDLSGNGNNGSLENGLTYSSLNGGSLNFDGTNQYVDLGTSTDFNLPGDFSLDAWIQLDTTKDNVIFNIGDHAGSSGIVFYAFNNSNNALSVVTNSAVAFSSGTVPLTTWTHTALVRSGSTNTLYINGTSIGTFTNSATFSGSGNAYLGVNYLNGTFGTGYFDGKISSARLYKGKALTAAEIQQNFNALRGRFGI
jgi:hypothetical protein